MGMRAGIFLRGALGLVFLWVLTCMVPGVWAEDVSLGEITVTATRTEIPVTQAPASVTIITKKDIEKSAAKTLPELLRTVPGVYVTATDGTLLEGNVSLRGFNPYGSEKILVMVDGVPWNSGYDGYVNWAKLPPLEAIEKIEIVRGPASALYGPFAMGGVINIITKSPKETRKTGSLAFGSDNEHLISAQVEGMRGRLGYLLGASFHDGDGWRDHSNFDRRSLFGKVNFTPGETSRLVLGFDYQNTDRLYPGSLTEAQYEEDPKQSIPDNWYSESGHLESWRSDITYNKQVGNYHIFKLTGFITRYDYDYPGPKSSYFGKIKDIGGGLQYQNLKPFFSKANSFVAGLDYRRENVDYQYYYRGSLSTDRNTKPTFWGIYLEDKISLFSDLDFYCGLRFDKAEYDVDDRRSGNFYTKSFDKWSPKIGLTYTPKRNLTIYANIAQAFMPPDPYKLFISRYANPNLEPEEATNYEVGIKTRILNRLYLELTGYWMNVDKEIVIESNRYENTGKVWHRGVEASIKFDVTEQLNIFVNYTYQDVKYDEYDGYDNNYRPYAPKYTIAGGVNLNPINNLSLNLQGLYVDKCYATSDNTIVVPSYIVWNFSSDYKFRKGKIYLKINNLFDENYYYLSYSSYSNLKKIYPYPGRTILVGLSLTF